MKLSYTHKYTRKTNYIPFKRDDICNYPREFWEDYSEEDVYRYVNEKRNIKYKTIFHSFGFDEQALVYKGKGLLRKRTDINIKAEKPFSYYTVGNKEVKTITHYTSKNQEGSDFVCPYYFDYVETCE